MVQYYNIAGQKVGSHFVSATSPPCFADRQDPANTSVSTQLAMGVLGALFGGIYVGVSGGSSKTPAATPPINASSSDEADFIKYAFFFQPCIKERGHADTRTGNSWRTTSRTRRRRNTKVVALDA